LKLKRLGGIDQTAIRSSDAVWEFDSHRSLGEFPEYTISFENSPKEERAEENATTIFSAISRCRIFSEEHFTI
jgi:hypothetical protein